MSKKMFVLFLVFFLHLSTCLFALDDFYEQNGDAFLLIGDGPARGIYKLNNLVAGTTPSYLYDGGKAFNLSASMLYNSTTNSVNKDLWTFSSDGATGMHLSTSPLIRKCLTSVQTKVNAVANTALQNQIVHIHHNYPGNTGSGIGIHDSVSYPAMYTANFDGNDYPCTWTPKPAPGKPGFYKIGNGRWYHSADDSEKIWSTFTYLKPDYFGTTTPTVIGAYSMYGFVQCTDGAGSPAIGGWCHKLIRETVQVNEEKLKLLSYSVDKNVGPIDNGIAGTVVLGSVSTKDTLNECGDPCAPGTGPGTPIPSGSTPILSCLVSGAGRSYLYTRDFGTSNYTLKLDNVGYASGTIGNPADLTAVKIGVSSKNATTDWVYILGTKKVNEWLDDAKIPSSGFLKELTDVSVSDQWWQTGGIVYAYDKTIPIIYSFVRNENDTKPCIPEVIDVSGLPDLPESIDADGFGNLYLVSTKRSPQNQIGKDIPIFTPTDAYAYESKSFMVPNLYRAKFRQGIYKGVTKRDYYNSGSFMNVSGDVFLGNNLFEQDFLCEPTEIDNRSKWSMCPGTLVRTTGKLSELYRTEIAVINVCTPPKISAKTATIDINGPFDEDLKPSPTPYNDASQYFFVVENSPIFDNNGVNRNSQTTDDPNGNGFIGKFPSTTKSSQIFYYWKVIQTKDMYGVSANNEILDGKTKSENSILPITFGPGEYKISVKSTFKIYEYDKMPRGVLADKKEDYLSKEIVAVAKDGSSWSTTTINIKTYEDPSYPGGSCVIMSGKPKDSTGINYDYHPKLISSNTDSESTLEKATPSNPVGEDFVIPQIKGSQLWSFQIRENLAKKKAGTDRIAAMLKTTPPVPGEPHNNLKWLTATPKFSWRISLVDPYDVNKKIVSLTDATNGTKLSISSADKFFAIPSEPGKYELRVDASRVYSYDYFKVTLKLLSNGTVISIPEQKTKLVTILIGAKCNVYVKDNTPPSATLADLSSTQQTAIDLSPKYLWGTTGEKLEDVAGSKSNPTNIVMWVADDNPYGNVPEKPIKTDPYFGISINHNLNKAIGKIQHANAEGIDVPDNLPIAIRTAAQTKYRNCIDGLNNSAPYKVQQYLYSFADFPSDCTLPKVMTWTYRKYVMPVNELDYFRTDNGNHYPEMSYDYANQLPNYANLQYGFSLTDASGNTNVNDFMDGQIIVRDNDRPLAFIQANDDKNEADFMVAPSNVLSTYIDGKWTCLAKNTGKNEENNGLEKWEFASISSPGTINDIDIKFRITKTSPVIPLLTTKDTNKPSVLEIDVPVTFRPKLSDNVGNAVLNNWKLRDSKSVLIKNIGSSQSFTNIFRSEGNYIITLEASDEALAWPDDPDLPKVASNSPNKRTLKVIIPISSSRLNIRTLDKNFK